MNTFEHESPTEITENEENGWVVPPRHFPVAPSEIAALLHQATPQIWYSPTHVFVRYSVLLLEHLFPHRADTLANTSLTHPQNPLLEILAHYPKIAHIYWNNRAHSLESAGIGIAHQIEGRANALSTALEAIRAATLHSPTGVRYYGGMRFHSETKPDALWEDFGELSFVLPLLEYERAETTLSLHCTICIALQECTDNGIALQAISNTALVGYAQTLLEKRLKELSAAYKPRVERASRSVSKKIDDNLTQAPLSHNTDLLRILARTNTPSFQDWKQGIEEALKAFQQGELDKAVLARRVSLHLASESDVIALLRERAKTAHRATIFSFRAPSGACFFGATPEYLYRRDGSAITTEAVAGTRPRGNNPADDERFGEELLLSDKDRREHASVQRYIASALDELTESFTIGSMELLKLSQLQHLYAPFTGRLRSDVSDATILGTLHPTPAVGGSPRREALEFLRSAEAFDRGWYAAPVGWVNAGGAEFVVAIRSALAVGNHLHLFSGAGIVAGSDAGTEWNEIEMKIAPLLNLLG